MSLSLYMEGATRNRRRPGPLATSLAIHAAAFTALLSTPEIKLPTPAKSEYKQAFEGKEIVAFDSALARQCQLKAGFIISD